MAIGTDAAVEFFGTQDTLGTSSAAVADAAFSVAGDLSTWTNDDDSPMASVILLANFSVAPDANSSINLYLRPLNIESTNDGDVPDANFLHMFAGSFPLNDVTTAQYITITVGLPNTKTSQEYEFYVQNDSGQSLPAGWDIYVTPKTIGPHA
tara:strand:+ start:50001 stop:50456 length:456 start_codon:yes stop_codon:yes gene_type:complete